jgi:hypothetical protein
VKNFFYVEEMELFERRGVRIECRTAGRVKRTGGFEKFGGEVFEFRWKMIDRVIEG